MKKYLRFEYLFIFMVLIWEPFQRFIIKVDGAGNTIASLSILVLLILFKKKSFYHTAFKKPLIIWCIWIIYSFINTLLKGYSSAIPISSFLLNISIPFLLMVVISLEFKRNQERLIKVLIFGFYIAVILIFLFSNETDQGRTGGEMNSNTIGTMATLLCMLLYYNFYKQKLKLILFIILIVTPLLVIISTGSRTAFGGVVLLLALHFFLNRSQYIFFTLSKIGLGALLLYMPINFILENTGLGERLMSTTTQSEDMTFKTGIKILDKFGDRGFFYYRGWEVFQENPLTGIGLENFKNYNHLELAQHSEYMIQLTEVGLIGFILFILFYFLIFKNLKKIKNAFFDINIKRETELYTYYVVIILIMITATRMYRVWFLFVIVGLVIGYINKMRAELMKADEGLISNKEYV